MDETNQSNDQFGQQQYQQQMYEAMMKQRQEQMRIHLEAQQSRLRYAEVQKEINNSPRQQYAAIVAVDRCGGFSKDGKIPWHYPEDFAWFQQKTKGHICVMGRTTYDDINKRLGKKAATSVLPGRQCYVVTSTPLPRDNATAIEKVRMLGKHLTADDAEQRRVVFFCGGEKIYSEGIALCDTVYTTIVDTIVEADRFFPIKYLKTHFNDVNIHKTDTAPDLRFVTWTRK